MIDMIHVVDSECFCPLAYGGGINTVDEITRILRLEVEKVAVNTGAIRNPEIFRESARRIGSQSIVGAMDIKASFLGHKYKVYNPNVRIPTSDPL